MIKGLSIVILSGGKSSRMGRDKGMLMIEGKTFIESIKTQIAGELDEVLFSVRSAEDYPNIEIKHIADEFPGCGPLSGIHSGLKKAHNDWTFVCACDMPFIERSLLEELMFYIDVDIDAIVPVTKDKREQVLCAFYHKRTVGQLEKQLLDHNYKVKDFVRSIKTRYVDISSLAGAEKIFLNINTPDAYEELFEIKMTD